MKLHYLRLIRIDHYIKNLLIFFPLFFSGKIYESVLSLKTIAAFVIFCFTASIIYIINDIRDVEFDSRHPVKKYRPIASKNIKPYKAVLLAIFMFMAVVLLNYILVNPFHVWIIVLIYFLINIAYSLGLKNIVLLDISIISLGFLLRLAYGAAVCSVNITSWMYLTVMAMSFYFALGKRRNELAETEVHSRKTLVYYTEPFISRVMYMCLTLGLVFYCLWCTTPNRIIANSEYLIWTAPIVILICIRYSMRIDGNNTSDPIQIFFEDKVLCILSLAYGAILAGLIYGTTFFKYVLGS